MSSQPKVLVIGGGGREHALAWRLHQSADHPLLFCAPGNGGTQFASENIPISETNVSALLEFAVDRKVGLTVVGPEIPLASGIVDQFIEKRLAIVGPTQAAAQLETSKVFAKEFMARHNIPTAPFTCFVDPAAAIEKLKSTSSFPVVIKADGLAAGKGVVVAKNRDHAIKAVREMMVDRIFGDSGKKIIIEEFLSGEEVSIIALVNAHGYSLLAPAQDHKAVMDNDVGPNTGGMGAYSPVPLVTSALLNKIEESILSPTVEALKSERVPFSGFLYAGLMIVDDTPLVLEYNVRLGDPETQPLMMRMDQDLYELLLNCAHGKPLPSRIRFSDDYAVCVVGTAPGYPGAYEKQLALTAAANFEETNKEMIFHAGTKIVAKDGRQELISTGGRVLGFCARASTLAIAQKKAYQLVNRFQFPRMHFRKDIGNKGLRCL